MCTWVQEYISAINGGKNAICQETRFQVLPMVRSYKQCASHGVSAPPQSQESIGAAIKLCILGSHAHCKHKDVHHM